MDIEKYLKQDIAQLEKDLISHVAVNPSEATEVVKILKMSDRYGEDPLFCICVDIAELILSYLNGDYVGVLSEGRELAERARTLDRPRLVSLAWNQLGSACFMYEMYEKAIECYHQVVLNEKKHDIHAYRSLAYNNIALILTYFKAGDRIRENLELAIESMKVMDGDPARNAHRIFTAKISLASYHLSKGSLEQTKALMEEFETMDPSLFLPDQFYNLYRLFCYCYIHIGDSERAKEFFGKNLEKRFFAGSDLPAQSRPRIFGRVYEVRCRPFGV